MKRQVKNMKIEENLRELRKQHGMSQEELAEKLEVSRQSVSKWENGSASPELDKLMQLCELFHCTLDDLLKGEMKESASLSKDVYEKEKKLQAILMTAGVALILFGVSLYCFLEPRFIEHEEYLNVIFLVFVMLGVMCMIIMSMKSSFFARRYPQIPLSLYSEKEITRTEHHYAYGVALGVGLLIAGVIVQQLLEQSKGDSFASGMFMLMVMCAVSIFIYQGMQKAKITATIKQPELSETANKAEVAYGVIMIVATGIYLLWSFVGQAWGISWIVFAIAGLICGIVRLLLHEKY